MGIERFVAGAFSQFVPREAIQVAHEVAQAMTFALVVNLGESVFNDLRDGTQVGAKWPDESKYEFRA